MNTDQKLRQLLTEAADSYDPPSPRRGSEAFLRRTWVRIVAVTAAAVIIVTALGLLIANVGDGRDSAASASTGTSSGASTPETAPAGGASTAGTAEGVAGDVAKAAPQAAASTSTSSTGTGSTAGTTQVPASNANARVVQTGQLDLEVGRAKVRPTLDTLSSIAVGAGGFVSASRVDDDATSSGTTTLRVPVASFAAVLAKARKLGHVSSASTTARDVTAQYVDLNARISALTQTRNEFYTLLTKANTIGDTLAVQQQITNVQTSLEQLQGQQKVLADSSDLATLSVSVTQTGAPAVVVKKHTQNGFSKALHRAGHAFNTGLQGIITVLGPLLLALIVLAVLAVLALVGRRIYRHYTRPAAP